MYLKTVLVKPSPIKSQITNTAVGFTLIALLSTVIFLIANAVAVGLTATNFPTPVIKTIAIKGLEEGPARVYVDIEFPGTRKGNLISAQTDGPLKVSLFLSEHGKALPAHPALFVEVPNGLNLNLASKTASRLVIDDLLIRFDKDFDAGILSKLLTAKLGNSLYQTEQLPNVQIKIETRVVFKSLWIPVGISVNYPHKLNLASLLPKPEEKTQSVAPQQPQPATVPIAPPQPQKELTEDEKKKDEIIKNFNFKPRSVKILASDSKMLEITAVVALPAIMIPEFLIVEVPSITLKANFFEVGPINAEDKEILSMLEVRIDRFLLQTAPVEDLRKEIQIKVSLLIGDTDVKGLTRLLELVRDEKEESIGIQILQGNSVKNVGGLMHWLKDFVVSIKLKDFLKKDDKLKNKQNQEQKEAQVPQVQESQSHDKVSISQPSNPGKNQVVSFKFLKTEKLPHGGSFIFQVKIARSHAAFFIGKLPEFEFDVEMESLKLPVIPAIEKKTHLFGVKVSSNEVTKTSKAVEINLKFEIENLKDLIYTGIRLGKLGSNKYHEMEPEIKAIRALKIYSKSDNIISKLAAIFNVEILLNDDGLEKIKFQKSERVIYPKEKEAEETKEDLSEAAKESLKSLPTAKKQMELSTKFTVNNDVDISNRRIVNIAALIKMDEIPYFGDYIHASWENFILKLKSNDEQTILQFKIMQGAMNLGITNEAKPISVDFSTGIAIPSETDDLSRLSSFLKAFLESEKDIIDLKFEIYSGSDLTDELNSFKLEAAVPCKQLLLADQTTEKHIETEEVHAKNADKTDEKVVETPIKPAEKIKPKTEIENQPKREDFIGKIENSILSFVSFQASTWLFHVTYPDGHYCRDNESFDLKLKIDVSLPMIEANFCSKPRIEDALNCFASAGISRPMKFSIDVVDGNICHVESVVLPQESGISLAGLSTIQQTTHIKYENNEIPIHISIRDFAKLVLFVEWAATKKRQFITVGPVKEGTGFNNLVGIIVSSAFSKEIPEPEIEIKDIKEAEIGMAGNASPAAKDMKNAVPKKIISFNPDDPAILQFQGSSINENNLEIILGFNLPSNTFENIRIAKVDSNRFEWPVLQWGMFEYNCGIKDVFDFGFSMSRGQIDIQDDLTGIVPSLLNNFGLRIKLTTNQEYKLGSTALRQVFGTFKSYFLNPNVDKSKLLEKYFKGYLEKEFFYKFVMNGPRGLNDPGVFFSKGMVPLRDLVTVGDAIFNRPKHPDDIIVKEGESVEKIKGEDTDKVAKQESSEENLFANAKITMKTISKEELSQIEFPCLIPALCKNSGFSNSQIPYSRVQENPFDMIFEVENILQPATQLIARHLGSVLEKMKMTHYPSHFRIKYTADTDIWITMMLNGAGIVSVGLKPFEFDRSAFISYNKETNVDFVPIGIDSSIVNSNGRDPIDDKFNIKLSVRFPDTITGLRSAMGIFRRESMLMPPITPVNLTAKESGENDVKLTNPPFVIALSSDDPYETTRGKNLLSALVAALIPETVLPGINLSDEFLATFFDGKKGSETKPPVKAEKDTDMKTEMGPLSYSKIPYIGACLLSNFFCDTQFDVNYNVMMPFAVDILKLILPSTSILRLYVDEAPIVQVVADSRKRRSLLVSSETGLDILGTANICFSGLRQISQKTTSNVPKYIWGAAELIPMKLRVILGHDIDITANLHFPFYTTKDIAIKMFKDSASSLVPDLSKNTYFGFFTGSSKKIPELPPNASEVFRNSRPERRVCLDNSVLPDQILERIENIDYSKTVLFLEQESIDIKPGKRFNVHLQMRTRNDLVVCGLPKGISEHITVKFVYETRKSFVNLINLISYERPPDHYEKEFKANYDELINLFSIKDVVLEHTGRYTVQMITGEGRAITLPDTIIYVTHEY